MFNTLYTTRNSERTSQIPYSKAQTSDSFFSDSHYRQRSIPSYTDSGLSQRRAPIRIFENLATRDPRTLELNRLNPLIVKPFNKTRPNIENSAKDSALYTEKDFDDIDEIEKNNENCSINRIPVSPIGLKQMTSPLLNLSHDHRFDTGHLSTEPSVCSTNTTPSQALKRIPYLRELNDTFGSDLKPPSALNSHRGHRLSIESSTEAEGKSGQKSGKKIFDSASKEEKISEIEEAASSIQGPHYSTAVTPSKPSSVLNDIKSTIRKYRRASQPVELDNMAKNTPPKVTRNISNENNTKTPSSDPIAKSLSFASQGIANFQSKIKNNYKASRSSIDERVSTTESMRKYFSSLPKLEVLDAKTWIKQMLTTSPRKNIKCSCDPNLPLEETCSRALKWISKRYKPAEFGYLKNTYEKILSEHRLAEPEQIKQIQKDINRTFPGCKFYEADAEGLKTLERVLNAVAKFDPNIGYVQGMNFIVGSLLYHAEEYIAFWILVTIFEILEMRDIYLPRLPGLSKHCQIIDMLTFNHQPRIYSKLCEYQIRAEMFCSEWVLTLFGSVVPIEDMGLLYDNLLDKGWPFFYKLILAFFGHFQKDLEGETDIVGVLTILKSQNHISTHSRTKSPYYIDWVVLCRKAEQIELDGDSIYDMHLKFDNDNLWFRTAS